MPRWRVPRLFGESGISVSEEQISKLKMFHVELLKFNQKLNLISHSSAENADILHIWDGVLAAINGRSWFLDKQHIYDLGSGNGIPGVICSILNLDTQWSSVDTDERKTAFLRHIRHTLHLHNFTVATADIRDFNFEYSNFISRGLSSFSGHAELLDQNQSLEGKKIEVCCLKGPGADKENDELKKKKGSTWNTKPLNQYAFHLNNAEIQHNLILLMRYS